MFSVLSVNSCSILLFFGRWQIDPELAPLSRCRFEIDLSAHSFDRFARNRQADARPFVLASWVNAPKEPENTIAILRGDPDAVVFDPEADVGLREAWSVERGAWSVASCPYRVIHRG